MAAQNYVVHSLSSDEAGVWEEFAVFSQFSPLQHFVFHRFARLKMRKVIWEKQRNCIKWKLRSRVREVCL